MSAETLAHAVARPAKAQAAYITALENALRELRNVLGPEPTPIDCGCDGCAVERGEAMEIVARALREGEA